MSDRMSIDKKDGSKDDSDESLASSPENENENEQSSSAAPADNQPPKRKGGRKPIYATSEERKQRNRQAQAAFRERRTEYIKQLEEAIRVHETNLSNLQAAHRSAADECLMLRYKNSLLERILLEKGIDVQAELRAKTGSPNLGPSHNPPNMVQPPPIHRAALNRHHNRRSASSIAPKLEPGISSIPTSMQTVSQPVASPRGRPTPPSHAASPTNPGTAFGSTSVASPATSDHASMRPPIPGPPKPQIPAMPGMMNQGPPRQSLVQPNAAARSNPYYATPSFQNHIEQLEQEYDAQADIIEEDNPETPGPPPYPTSFAQSNSNTHMAMQQQSQTTMPPGQPMMPAATQPEQGSTTQGQGYPSMTQLLDPALDWDPFGLSASMAFPTQFSFDTSNMR